MQLHAANNSNADIPMVTNRRSSFYEAAMEGLTRVPTYLQPRLSARQRLHHFTFAWYTLSMSTSGIALVLGMTPHRFRGLDIIGLVICIVDIVFFVFTTIALALRFIIHKHTFRDACTRPKEALFIPTFFLSIAAILSNIGGYGDMFLKDDTKAKRGLDQFNAGAFWTYLGVTFPVSVIQYHLLFTVKQERRLKIDAMTPAWILPIFPVMLAGTLAGSHSKTQDADQAAAIVAAGLAAQGLGMLVSIFNYSTYLSRLMTYGLPDQRPGMFIAVGPPSFTCAALVAMSNDVPRIVAEANPPLLTALVGAGNAATVAAGVRLLAINAAIFLWGLAFWFFASAATGVLSGMPEKRFRLSWWSFVFPNVGFAIASFRLGDALHNNGVLWLGTVLTILLVIVWLFVLVRCVRAVYKREIMWPGHDEDTI